MSYKVEQYPTLVNKGAKGSNKPQWIIVHFVGAAGQAWQNGRYFRSIYRGASAHYFVDPTTTLQVVEDDRSAWHIGDGHRTGKGPKNGYHIRGGATNTNSIGIEGCQDVSTGKDVWHWDFHPETVNRIEALVKDLQKKYNIDDDHVIRHFDATGKLCPGNWSHNSWGGWKAFKKRLLTGIKQPVQVSNPGYEGKPYDDDMYLVEAGDTLAKIAQRFKVKMDLLVKWNDLEDANLIFPETKLHITEPKVDDDDLDISQAARDVLAGKYGNGAEREKKLGDNYEAVQAEINRILAGNAPKKNRKSTDTLAREVLAGKHGSGDARKTSLGSRYNEVQKRVNQLSGITSSSVTVAPGVAQQPTARPRTIEQLANDVIDGKLGSGDKRRKALGKNYNAVQARVNEILGSKAKPSGKTIGQLADEVMKGKHGSGRDRMRSLGSKYVAVQAEVNRRAHK